MNNVRHPADKSEMTVLETHTAVGQKKALFFYKAERFISVDILS